MNLTKLNNGLMFILFIAGCWFVPAFAITGVSVPVTTDATITQGITASVSTVKFGGFFTGETLGGNLTLSNDSCIAMGTGSVQALSGAECGALTVDATPLASISINVLNTGNFTLGDGNGHSISGQITLSGLNCYVSGGFPLCSDIKVGGVLMVNGMDTNPAGVYSTATGGTPAQISLTYT
jgi:hypothetical protein